MRKLPCSVLGAADVQQGSKRQRFQDNDILHGQGILEVLELDPLHLARGQWDSESRQRKLTVVVVVIVVIVIVVVGSDQIRRRFR